MVITTEFSKEAPKAVAKFADKQAFKLIQNLDELNNKNIDITSDEYQNTIKEIAKWDEGAGFIAPHYIQQWDCLQRGRWRVDYQQAQPLIPSQRLMSI
ncbi:hypothetical protein [Moraxella catarrhalis]|uniref:hypothetical protein n=1 Tax=Moraxella catarrhalis TaxID=480 RepID=UPI00217DC75E|nr:hypothetical protein [Moraxella catarrhalis]